MGATIEIVRLDDGQIPAAAGVLARAFFPDPLFTHVLPDEPHRAAALPAIIRSPAGNACTESSVRRT